MIYMLCPTCGALLRHKQIVYEDRIEKLCTELGINTDIVSKGIVDRNPEFVKRRSEIVNELCEKMCCRIYMITYISVGKVINP